MRIRTYFVGTAGWSIASRHSDQFSRQGSHLERYAARLGSVEINSSFYKPHRRQTYERWAAAVADDFRFSVKIPRTITHERRLNDCDTLIDTFLSQAHGLGAKLGIFLVQLPPSLRFDTATASGFLDYLRKRTDAAVVCEPRHESWFTPDVDAMLASLQIARVAADPPPYKDADRPAGYSGIAYFRMHGSPHIYNSDYSKDALKHLTQKLRQCREAGKEVWCIFDNTAQGHALGNALAIEEALSELARY